MVIEKLDNLIKLKIIKGEECASCEGHSCTLEGREFTARNTKGINLEIGDTVRVYLPPGKAILASFMILIFPLILFLIFYFVSGLLFNGLSEGARALFGVAGMAAGFGSSLLLRKQKKEEHMPEIVRKQNS
jgi:positive regulator of sigma E activity